MPDKWNSFVSVNFPEMTGEEIKNSDYILVKTIHKRMTYREFLQRLGTEAMRDGLHTNAWVNALFADYRLWSDGSKDWYPNWIITDMRFPNEMDAVKERKGITIKVVRPCTECGGIGYHKMSCSKQYQEEHPSETSLKDAEFDYEIVNDAGIPELVDKVKELLIKEGILV
jgi:hypothetical protein